MSFRILFSIQHLSCLFTRNGRLEKWWEEKEKLSCKKEAKEAWNPAQPNSRKKSWNLKIPHSSHRFSNNSPSFTQIWRTRSIWRLLKCTVLAFIFLNNIIHYKLLQQIHVNNSENESTGRLAALKLLCHNIYIHSL